VTPDTATTPAELAAVLAKRLADAGTTNEKLVSFA
jgi:hypothetical protein